ncbi:hypothetical protein TWF694_011540 [Orbilia ellipsospora]|uniref:Uncharacterized protein n=1 Tax=Orbilia ellipsospora TaxID=2528407 RepID=A0AAV9XBR3_9PEZI
MSALNFDIIFNGDNWEPYKEYILHVIESTGGKELIEGTSIRPASSPNMDPFSESNTPSKRPTPPEIVSPRVMEWDRLDNETKRIILESCDDTRKQELEQIPTAYEMWDTLRSKYDIAKAANVGSSSSEYDSGDSDSNLEVGAWSGPGGRVDMAEHADLPPFPLEIRLKTISPGSETDHWEQNLDSIMALLDGHDIPWSVIHLGSLDEEATMVLIHGEGGDWNKDIIETELRASVLPKRLFPRLEFLHGEVMKAGALGAGAYEPFAFCGASIGVQGLDWSAGTVGGYLESGGVVYGLTCHHVALPTKRVESSSKGKTANTDYPSYLDDFQRFHKAFDKTNGEIIIAQPSCSDHRDTIESCKIDQVAKFDLFQSNKLEYEMLGSPVGPKADRIDALGTSLERAGRDIERLQQTDRKFGHLIASSGYRIDQPTGNSMDWAIFRLVETRGGSNRISHIAPRIGWSCLKGSPEIDFNAIADPEIGEKVIKIGKESGVTFGIIHSVRDGVSLPENGCKSKEWCVCRYGPRRSFSEFGDSGSFIFNTKLQVVGILTSGTDNEMFTYMTPIKMVLRDIKEKTGLDLFISGKKSFVTRPQGL